MSKTRKQVSVAVVTKLSPRQQIAKEVAAKINAINEERDRQIKQVYEEFQLKQKLIESERDGNVVRPEPPSLNQTPEGDNSIMTDPKQQLEELKQMYYQKFPQGAQLEPLSKTETLKYSQLPQRGIEAKQEINKLVIEILLPGEVTGSELHSKLEGYGAGQRLDSLLYLLNEGYLVQTKTGFKLTPQYRVRQQLVSVLDSLKNIHTSMQSAGLDNYGGLNAAVCDAITATQQACDRAMDVADE